MKNTILDLISTKPKHYVLLIKSNQKLMNWINENSLIAIDSPLSAKIYSAISQETNICKYGETKKLKRISSGFQGCGPAATCKCTQEKISESVSLTKKAVSKQSNSVINDKRKASMLKKYGVSYNSQREEIKHIWTKSKISEYATECLRSKEWLNEQYNTQGKSLVDIADSLSIYYSTVAEYCRLHEFTIRRRSNYSMEERSVSEFLNELGIDYITGDWTLLGSKEIDIYIPSAKIAIELNGLYWHSWAPSSSNKPENKMQHLNKTIALEKLGIELLHITDYEWNQKTDIIKGMLKSKLGLNNRIHGRQCQVKLVNVSEEREFLNTYHIQGYVASNSAWGLYHYGKLVQLLTIGWSRFDKNYDLEILRSCSSNGISVVGGLSKLISKVKMHYNTISSSTNTIVTYCDRSMSKGAGYLAAGFTMVRKNDPSYCWTDGNETIRRYKCQTKNLSKWLLTFDPSLTEAANMFSAKYRRYWDCGNFVLSI